MAHTCLILCGHFYRVPVYNLIIEITPGQKTLKPYCLCLYNYYIEPYSDLVVSTGTNQYRRHIKQLKLKLNELDNVNKTVIWACSYGVQDNRIKRFER